MKKILILLVFNFLIADEEVQIKQWLYSLDGEITSEILAQPSLPKEIKERFVLQNRRFFVFSYPSDGMQIKSMVSFTGDKKPVIVLLRGASRLEALPAFLYPSKEVLFSFESDATIVAACYRDGVSEGKDEYGGSDVNDVYNLANYLPSLFETLEVEVDRQYMVGISRGGMQMFLALAKFPELQKRFNKFVSLNGILNINLFAARNPDWYSKMKLSFDFDGSKDWLDNRNPLLAIEKITKRDLPILLIQGTADPKVALQEGYSLLDVMQKQHFSKVTYWEVEGGDHTLKNRPDYIRKICKWLDTSL